MKNNPNKLGFSLLEISVIILIIGILIASVSSGRSIIKKSRITSAQTLSANSPVSAVDTLAIWLEPVMSDSISEDETHEGKKISGWQNMTNYFAPQKFNIIGDPSYKESSINKIPSINFDGNDAIDINNAIRHITGSNFAIFIVEKRDDKTGKLIASNNIEVEYVDNKFKITQNTTAIQTDHAVADGPAINYISFASYQNGAAPAGTTYYRNQGVFIDSNSGEKINHTIQDTSTSIIPTISNATLGDDDDTSGFKGDISELIIYGQSLTFLELDEVLKYLSTKYQIELERS
jgi:type II secretory pathway pseudopilin PulG